MFTTQHNTNTKFLTVFFLFVKLQKVLQGKNDSLTQLINHFVSQL